MNVRSIHLSVCVPSTSHLPQYGKQDRSESKKIIQIITSSFVVVHVDSLQLQVTVSMVTASGVDPMLITDDFPKLGYSKRLHLATPDGQRGRDSQ